MQDVRPQDVHALSEAELFQPVGRDRMEAIAALATVFEVPGGQVLARIGDHSDHLFGICEGIVQAEVPTLTGPQFLPISAPEVCAWPGLIYPYTQIGTLTAVTDCRLLAIPIQSLRTLLDADDELRATINHQLAVLAVRRIHAVMAMIQGQEPYSSNAPA